MEQRPRIVGILTVIVSVVVIFWYTTFLIYPSSEVLKKQKTELTHDQAKKMISNYDSKVIYSVIEKSLVRETKTLIPLIYHTEVLETYSKTYDTENR